MTFSLRGLFTTILLVGAASACLPADVILLKNGRRIVAENVVEEPTRVRYESDAGTYSVPRSMVDRIERGGLGRPRAADIALPEIHPPVSPIVAYEAIAAQVIHDGSVNHEFVAQLETDAHANPSPENIARVAAAHDAVAQFLAAKGDLDGAVRRYEQALTFAPDNLPLMLNLSYVLLRQNRYTQATEHLERARRDFPDSADVATLLGWAYYSAEKMDRAVEEWKRSLRLRPDPRVDAALQKAERERATDETYGETESGHFVMKYHGGAAGPLAREILRTLEDQYNEIASDLDFYPREPVVVILYPNDAFADVTRMPSWVGAINDGKIRVPVQGLTSVTNDLRRVLRHELTHSFVVLKTRGHCPAWLNEGLAQWQEGATLAATGPLLARAFAQRRYIPLAQLEGSILGLGDEGLIALAYAESLAAVNHLLRTYGASDLRQLLERLANPGDVETALRETLRTDYAEIEQGIAVMLQSTYGQPAQAGQRE